MYCLIEDEVLLKNSDIWNKISIKISENQSKILRQ